MRRVTLGYVVAILAVLGVLNGCDSGSEPDPEPEPQDLRLTAGTEFMYRWMQIGLDSLGNEVTTIDTKTYTVRVVAEDETVESFSNLFRLEAVSTDGEQGPTTSWYQLSDNALRDVAYVGAGLVPDVMPKRASQPTSPTFLPTALPESLDPTFQSNSDSIIVRSVPRVVYALPLDVGKSWISVNESFLQVDREVVRQETVEVEAGTFEATVISATFSPIEGVTFVEHVSDLVMVKRVSELPNDLLREIGIVRLREVVELMQVRR